MDEVLTNVKLQAIFNVVNASSEDEEGGDDDAAELVYSEWVQLIARVCDAKIPEAVRGGAPFERTLQNWLHLVFLPTYKKVLKDKARGLASKTL